MRLLLFTRPLPNYFFVPVVDTDQRKRGSRTVLKNAPNSVLNTSQLLVTFVEFCAAVAMRGNNIDV